MVKVTHLEKLELVRFFDQGLHLRKFLERLRKRGLRLAGNLWNIGGNSTLLLD